MSEKKNTIDIRKQPWKSRYAWIWYNSKEIFENTQEDMDKLVESFYDKGVNIVIGFSSTHFRWSFYRYWDQINACIEKIVKSCNKYGILYIEHHSCHLTFNALTPDDEQYMHDLLSKRGSKMEDFPHLVEDSLNDDMMIYGKYPISSFRQISGKSGKWGISTYHGYGMCFNNPHYRESYFKYLQSLYNIGIDGIMTDDVQFFGNDGMGWKAFNACTCTYCRDKFRQRYGYEIPQPEQWQDFYWNFKNPVFIAWKRFKDESTLEFVYEVKKHYEEQGIEQYRPNYVSAIIMTNKTSYPFEKCADIWDCVFQENTTAAIIKESYLSHAMEALHRYNLGRLNKIPSMSMYYPSTQDSLYFSWALTKSWGQLYSYCEGEGVDNKQVSETPYIQFENKHTASYTNPKKITDMAFMLSFDTRDYSDGCETHQYNFVRWMQAAYLSGIAVDMVFENASLRQLKEHKIIVCPHTVMLSDKVIAKLRKYVKDGGHLITVGDFAKYKEDGSLRSRITIGRKNQDIGEGKVTVLSDSDCHDKMHWVLDIHRISGDAKAQKRQVPEYSVQALRETGGKTLLEILDNKTILSINTEQDIHSAIHEVRYGYAVHIVNVQDTISKQGEANHYDPVPAYIEGAKAIQHEMQVNIDIDIAPKSIMLYSPERKRALRIQPIHNNNTLSFTIPSNTFSGYALIEIRK